MYYCDTCETVYPYDSVRAGICPVLLGVTCNRCLADMLLPEDDDSTKDVYGLAAEFSTGYEDMSKWIRKAI